MNNERGTGRTYKMILDINKRLFKRSSDEVIIIIAPIHREAERIYLSLNIIDKKNIIYGGVETFRFDKLYGIELKKENIFIDHSVYEYPFQYSNYQDKLSKLLEVINDRVK